MATKPKYRALTGINYPPNGKRAEAGDVVTDLPETAIVRLLRDGAIEEVLPKKEEAKRAEEPKEEVVVEHVAVTPEDGVKVTEEKVER